MLFNDFNYRDKNLSDYDCMICSFDKSSGTVISIGANLNFTMFKQRSNNKFMIANANYNEPLSATFQICKNPCLISADKIFTLDDVREITDWLQTERYFKFQPYNEEYDDIIYNGTFTTISLVQHGTNIIGLEVTFVSETPWAHGQSKTIQCSLDSQNEYIFYLDSDKYGSLYPASMEITVKEDGDLNIFNRLETNHITKIKNCSANEVINIDFNSFTITSNHADHDIANDFNYIYLHLNKTYESAKNVLTANMQCLVKIKYFPIRKVGVS